MSPSLIIRIFVIIFSRVIVPAHLYFVVLNPNILLCTAACHVVQSRACSAFDLKDWEVDLKI
jgi:hypothetical protein